MVDNQWWEWIFYKKGKINHLIEHNSTLENLKSKIKIRKNHKQVIKI
jgi:hypothetical protein